MEINGSFVSAPTHRETMSSLFRSGIGVKTAKALKCSAIFLSQLLIYKWMYFTRVPGKDAHTEQGLSLWEYQSNN